MALLQGLLLALFRFLGKILNTAIGWATIMLFGKVAQNRQTFLSLAAFASLIWLVAILGVAFPTVGLWLLSFVRLPAGVDPDWVRLAMLAGIVALPLLVGAILLVLFERHRRARRGGLLPTLLRGYPYTLGLATTMVMMCVFAPVARLRHAARRWSTMHVPIIIEDEHYTGVVGDVQRALAAGGIETRVQRAPLVLRASLRLLAILSGKGRGGGAAENLSVLKAPGLEILLHPSDLVIGAAERDAARARAILATELTATRAYRTYSRDANDMEDGIRTLWEAVHHGAVHPADLSLLRGLEDRLATLPLDFEEWEELHRQILLLDRRLTAELTARSADGSGVRVAGRALGTLARTVAQVALATATTMLRDGKETVIMDRVRSVFQRQNDADRAIAWLREQGIPDRRIVAVTKDRRAEETSTDREPPGETVVEVLVDEVHPSTTQIAEGLRRLNGRVLDG